MFRSGVLYHGTSARRHGAFRIPADRGAYFTTDKEYASGYGPRVLRATITLSNPAVYTEEESQGDMEIDRRKLIKQGYDGRIIRYDDGNLDVIAFYPSQIEWLSESNLGGFLGR